MQKIIIALFFFACLICIAAAANDVESIQRQIIAEYEKFGGHSVHHPPEVADVIDPEHLHVYIN